MIRIVTSDEFVTLILATLKLRDEKAELPDAELDRSFQEAYEDLSLHEAALRVSSNFTFFTDPLHGNSTKLRRAIVWARDRGFLEPKHGSRGVKYAVNMSPELARRFLASSAIDCRFLEQVVTDHFPRRSSEQATV